MFCKICALHASRAIIAKVSLQSPFFRKDLISRKTAREGYRPTRQKIRLLSEKKARLSGHGDKDVKSYNGCGGQNNVKKIIKNYQIQSGKREQKNRKCKFYAQSVLCDADVRLERKPQNAAGLGIL